MDFSIIIPVLREESIIQKQLQHVVDIFSGESFEIIVVDGDSQGKTIAKIERQQVTKIISQPGRAMQMNAGAEVAKGTILIFLHVDTLLPKHAPRFIKNTILSGYNAGAFDLSIQSEYWILRFISITSSLRSRFTRIPYGDQVHFFERDFFFALGNYKEMAIMEDIEIMQRIKRRKKSIFMIPQKVKTSDRRWRKQGILYVMIRNPILSLLYFCGVSTKILIRLYK